MLVVLNNNSIFLQSKSNYNELSHTWKAFCDIKKESHNYNKICYRCLNRRFLFRSLQFQWNVFVPGSSGCVYKIYRMVHISTDTFIYFAYFMLESGKTLVFFRSLTPTISPYCLSFFSLKVGGFYRLANIRHLVGNFLIILRFVFSWCWCSKSFFYVMFTHASVLLSHFKYFDVIKASKYYTCSMQSHWNQISAQIQF